MCLSDLLWETLWAHFSRAATEIQLSIRHYADRPTMYILGVVLVVHIHLLRPWLPYPWSHNHFLPVMFLLVYMALPFFSESSSVPPYPSTSTFNQLSCHKESTYPPSRIHSFISIPISTTLLRLASPPSQDDSNCFITNQFLYDPVNPGKHYQINLPTVWFNTTRLISCLSCFCVGLINQLTNQRIN